MSNSSSCTSTSRRRRTLQLRSLQVFRPLIQDDTYLKSRHVLIRLKFPSQQRRASQLSRVVGSISDEAEQLVIPLKQPTQTTHERPSKSRSLRRPPKLITNLHRLAIHPAEEVEAGVEGEQGCEGGTGAGEGEEDGGRRGAGR